ncbi:WbqC family protein [Subsaxibacter sp. CAU 1640]|uniref:WbqC family protein n=1 Tax=Subsaxibacter sp. CAU 1640 TaxID=2933271 RepID=UPI002004D992|nr:WbqC family protein [Subsaxibacter sp. CAU 1640]MCK7591778.1 WbqC family protein [Subsaxibacter sp. CAU 1640]
MYRVLVHPTYFPSIATFVAIVNAKNVTFEVCDNYQKQTYRNRMFIYDANGKLPLTIPVVYSQKNRQLYKDIVISNDENWQDLHWKSIQSAYSSSPFFEFYEYDFLPLFTEKYKYLLDFNFKCLETIYDSLELPIEFETTKSFEKKPQNFQDYRYLADNRKEIVQDFKPYVQVFDDKHGFIPNLSILDLICNEGPNATLYLEAQSLL